MTNQHISQLWRQVTQTLQITLKILTLSFFIGLNILYASKQESEHPPLSMDTKRAIATYQRNPTQENKEGILRALNKAYDSVIAQKQDKLAQRVKDKDKMIEQYINLIKRGKTPPFMNNTQGSGDLKGMERQRLSQAIKEYHSNPKSERNLQKVREVLNEYYEAFLEEQRVHIKETIDLRESRIAESLERFSKGFKKPIREMRKPKEIAKEDILLDIIIAYISIGAEFVPVNPEARVREREFNAKINNAFKQYEANKSAENRENLRIEILNALQNALKVRLQELARAEQKGINASHKLLKRMQDEEFLISQLSELTQQRNLYGRIDRIITFGSADYEPQMREDSRKLFAMIKDSNTLGKTSLSVNTIASFEAYYTQSLKRQKAHLDSMQGKLEGIADSILGEMVREYTR